MNETPQFKTLEESIYTDYIICHRPKHAVTEPWTKVKYLQPCLKHSSDGSERNGPVPTTTCFFYLFPRPDGNTRLEPIVKPNIQSVLRDEMFNSRTFIDPYM